MPTGYTASIADGISFKEYALSCARAFGALIMMRDEPLNAPIPKEMKPSDYHVKALKEAGGKLYELQSMSERECIDRMEGERKELITKSLEYIDKNNDLLGKYNTMLIQVKAYTPPTPDHKKFKEFMIEQIESSIKWDCGGDYYFTQLEKFPCNVGQWMKEKINKYTRDIAYHTQQNAEEIMRTNSNNLWVKQLMESLK